MWSAIDPTCCLLTAASTRWDVKLERSQGRAIDLVGFPADPCGEWNAPDPAEVYLKIDGRMVYLWRAVDAEGEVLDALPFLARGVRRAACRAIQRREVSSEAGGLDRGRAPAYDSIYYFREIACVDFKSLAENGCSEDQLEFAPDSIARRIVSNVPRSRSLRSAWTNGPGFTGVFRRRSGTCAALPSRNCLVVKTFLVKLLISLDLGTRKTAQSAKSG